ncbi:MAG: hypothetical protein CVV21_04370 [Candidatus Goldiibacteriota bacterium HGW-Goldbacteria-1]|jgi:chromosome segregation ATPase|nr:MAG: hypothetical protein CVV21_04370 [Candidatus Goldiibacteriota bacterium HGW-Goldbacteria-1]
MKPSNLFLAVIFFIMSSALFAEGAVTPAAQPDNTVFQEKLDAAKNRSDSALKAAEDAITAAQAMKQEMAALKTELERVKNQLAIADEKSIETRSAVASLAGVKESIALLDERFIKYKEKADVYMKEFSDVKQQMDARTGKMQSWDDIMGVLRKEIENNEREIARLKKEINGLKSAYGTDDNVLNMIASWPYIGLTALVVSIITFGVVLTK